MIPMTTIEDWVSTITHKPGTQIECLAQRYFPNDEQGFVRVDPDTGHVLNVIYLPKARCRRLQHLKDPTPTGEILVTEDYHGQDADTMSGQDVTVTVHEAEHIYLDSDNECDVQRAAMHNIWQLVRRFKLPAWKSRQVQVGAVVVDQDPTMPAEYHEGCTQ